MAYCFLASCEHSLQSKQNLFCTMKMFDEPLWCHERISSSCCGNMEMTTTFATFPTWVPFYYYNEDYDDELCHRTDIAQIGAYFTPPFFILVAILSLFGNVLVIVILTKYENPRNLTNAFILNLAVSDLLFTVGLPFWAYYYMYGWTLGEPACKIVSFIFYVGFYSSGVLLVLMTSHRYVAVMNPLSEIVSTKGFWSVVVSLVIWAVSIVLASPVLIFSEVQNEKYCEFGSNTWTLWGFYQQNAFFVLTSVVFIFCYSQIICRLMRPNAQRRKVKTLKVIFALIVVFFVTWGPYNVVIFLQSFYYFPKEHAQSKDLKKNCDTLKHLDYALYVCRLFAFAHCCLNPVFYVFVGVKFNNHLKRMLKSWGHGNQSVRSRHSRLTVTSLTSGEDLSI